MYEEMMIDAENNGILVIEESMEDSLGGLYSDNIICINSKLSNNEKSCILAEEMGHHFTNAGDILDQSKIENRKQEYIARKWGYERRLPLENIVEALNQGAKNKYELSQHLDVPEWYVDEVIQFYNCKYGDYQVIENVIVYFNPFRVGIMFDY